MLRQCIFTLQYWNINFSTFFRVWRAHMCSGVQKWVRCAGGADPGLWVCVGDRCDARACGVPYVNRSDNATQCLHSACLVSTLLDSRPTSLHTEAAGGALLCHFVCDTDCLIMWMCCTANLFVDRSGGGGGVFCSGDSTLHAMSYCLPIQTFESIHELLSLYSSTSWLVAGLWGKDVGHSDYYTKGSNTTIM